MVDFALSDEERQIRDTVRAFIEREVMPLEADVLRNERAGRPGIERDVIRELQRVSAPGLRRYVKAREIPRVKNGLGMAILSTPQGLMTDREARQRRVGGEILCQVW